MFSAAAWVRLDQLGGPSLWLDEILTVERTRSARIAPLGEWFTGFSFDREIGPLFYASEVVAGAATGDEWRVRIPAALAGILTVGITMLAGRRLGGTPTALLAGTFLAFSPAHVAYSREGRPYALFMLGAAILAWLWVEAAGQRRRIPTMAWVLAGVLLAAVGAVAGAVLVAAAGMALTTLRDRNGTRKADGRRAGAGALAGLAAVAGLYLSTGRFQPAFVAEPIPGITRPGSWTSIERLVASLTTAGVDALATPNALSWALLSVGLFGALALARSPAGRGVAILALATPVVTLAALALTGHWYSIRYTLVALPAFALCFAFGAGNLLDRWSRKSPRVGAGAVATLGVLLAVVGWNPARKAPWERIDWRNVAADAVAHSSAGTPILTTSRWTTRCLGHYLDRSGETRRLVPADGAGTDVAQIAAGVAPCLVVSGGFHSDRSAVEWARSLPRLDSPANGDAVVAVFPDAPGLVPTLGRTGRANWAERVRTMMPLEFDGSARLLLGPGWGPPENDPDGRTYRWMFGDSAVVLFALPRTATAIRLTARAFEGIAAPTVQVRVSYDGTPLRRFPLGTDWRQVTIPVPADDRAESGPLRFELEPRRDGSGPAPGAERRPLGIAVDRLSVAEP